MPRSGHVVVFVSLFLAPVAGAEPSAPDAARSPQRWLVVPTLVEETETSNGVHVESMHRIAEALRHELSVRGEEVWPADRASERYEAVGSAPATKVSQSDIDRWVERSRAAVRYLARADYKAARRELKAAQRLANRAAEELNREAARAQQVLDTCLFMVRAYVETKSYADAHRQARDCRQLVPRVEPSAFRHTPEVRALLAQVDEEIASEAPGEIEVQSVPPDCLVRVNGVELGRTPLSGIELPVGTYRLQVECEQGRRGRIHRVLVVSGRNRFHLDAGLERAVRTRPVLRLEYDSPDAWADRMTHATRVGRTLGSMRILVVSALEAEAVRVDLAAEGYEPASAWLTADQGAVERDDVRRVIDALLEGRSTDFTGAHPIARAGWADEPEDAAAVETRDEAILERASPRPARGRRPRKQRIAGWSLISAGVASIGTGIGLHVWRGELGDRFVAMPADLSEAQRWKDARIGVWTTAAFGGAVTSAAMPLVLPDDGYTPWWGWVSGTLGLGLAGYSIYEGATMTPCPEPFIADESAASACVGRGQEAGRVSLALAGAAPLLTVPLVYLMRPLRAVPSVSVSGAGAVVKIGKAF